MLPSISQNIVGAVKSCYIYDKNYPHYNKHIFVVYENNHFIDDSDDLVFNYTSGFNEIVHVYRIPEKYYNEFEKFKLGKYSEFNYNYKIQIFAFHQITDSKCRLAKVLFKHPDMRLELEQVLDCKIPSHQELSSIPDDRMESYPKSINDLEYSTNIIEIKKSYLVKISIYPKHHFESQILIRKL
jgi:hypothetical protein